VEKLNSVILVVDDDFDVRDTIGEALEDEGYRVIRASHGLEALRLLKQNLNPDLILLDLMMPVMDGSRLRAEMLKDEQLAGIPVVMLSADNRLAERVRSMGIDGVLGQPVLLGVLVGTVATVLKARRRSQALAGSAL